MTMAYEHRYRRRVQFAETDMAGIVHFSCYFRYAEEAEHDFYLSLGVSVHSRHQGVAFGLPRLGARLEYLRPLYCEDCIEVHLWVHRKGRSSVVYQLEILKAGEQVARGEIAVASCRTHADGRVEPIPLPSELAQGLEVAPYPPLEFRRG